MHLTLEDAIRAYRIDPAYLLHAEKYIGSNEASKRDDMIVLDQNLFESTTDEIAKTNVLAAMMNGKVVHKEAVGWSVPDPADKLKAI